MKCEICKCRLLSDCQFINSKYYHNKCIEKTIKENQQLKQELEKLKKPINYYQYASKNLKDKNEQLQNNWNELKKWVLEQEQKAWDEVSSTFSYVLNKMQELEGKNE